MPTIVFASPKGGAGKSTSAVVLATELAGQQIRTRPEFLAAVAAELEAGAQAGAVGIGSVHRVGRVVQRRFFDPPQLPNAGKMARA